MSVWSRASIGTALLLVFFLVGITGTAGEPEDTSERRQYIALTGVTVMCGTSVVDIGGSCHDLPENATTLTVQIEDDAYPSTQGELHFLVGDTHIPMQPFCSETTVGVPEGATTAWVHLGIYGDEPEGPCGGATSGDIVYTAW